MEPEVLPAEVVGPPKVTIVRGHAVILDADLAPRLGVETKRLNEAVKRNAARFPADWMFRLTTEEVADLQLAKPRRGGARYRPWVFTEHGVVMATSVLKSPTAIKAMQYVVQVFIEARQQASSEATSVAAPGANLPAKVSDGFGAKLKGALDNLLDSIIDRKNQVTVREEALNLASEAILSLKERLRKSGVENEEIAARATHLLAQAESEKAVAAKTIAETEQIQFATLVKKLRLLMAAELLIDGGDVSGFISVLDELSHP
jgi:hypothetical protein